MIAPLVFMDTETTGLSLDDDVWEFAAIRREPDGSTRTVHLFLRHDTRKCRSLPESFLADHQARFPSSHTAEWHPDALSVERAARQIAEITAGAHVVGAVPNFDTERLALLLGRHGWTPEWHYHLIDVENLAVGYLAALRLKTSDALAPPWDSEILSSAVGIDPDQFERHTALGDAQWAMAIYDAVMAATA
jgi:hypothetical protein